MAKKKSTVVIDAPKRKRVSRQPKNPKVARTRAGNTWTEAQYWGFIRSHLRKMSLFWPPRKNALLAARRPYNGPNKRQKFEYLCSICLHFFPQKEVQVEHTQPTGELRALEHLPVFVERLLAETEHLTVQCKTCHQRKTDFEREARRNLRD